LARSASDVIPFGFPGATMIDSRFVAKFTGADPFKTGVVNLSMFAVSADANRSAGAPSIICFAKVDDASKLNVTFTPGFFFVNAAPTSLNAVVKDDAANTVIDPLRPATVVGA
jgi:hypothetical protein